MYKLKETKNYSIAEVTDIFGTKSSVSPEFRGEDTTFWVCYKIGDKCGRNLVKIEDLEPYNVGDKIYVENKPSIENCSKELKELIDECHCSLDSFIELDGIEPFNEKVLKIKNEVLELDKKYENLKLHEYFEFNIDEDGYYMKVDTALITRFMF